MRLPRRLLARRCLISLRSTASALLLSRCIRRRCARRPKSAALARVTTVQRPALLASLIPFLDRLVQSAEAVAVAVALILAFTSLSSVLLFPALHGRSLLLGT